MKFSASGGKSIPDHPNLFVLAKKIIIEGCKQSNAQSFSKIGESKELPGRSGLVQDSVKVTESTPVNLIKFIIADGHEEFTSVHSVEIA